MKFNITFAVFVSLVALNVAGQKKTHKHEKFVKKVVLYMNTDVGHWAPDDDAIKYISERSEKSEEELKERVKENIKKLEEDVAFLNENGIYRKYDDISVEVKQESPLKVADIVMHCDYKGDKYDITLQNCVQTDVSWYLGDGIKASGEGVADAISKNEQRDEKAKNGLLARMGDVRESAEAVEAEGSTAGGKKVYEATRFQMKGTDATTQFVRHENVGKMLDGYYIDKNYKKHEKKILYQAPEILMDPNQSLMVSSGGAAQMAIGKDQLKAFYVGGQMYVFSGEYWDILVKEGAIRRLARAVKNEETGNYVLAELVQKFDEGPENTASLMLGFKNKMSDMTSENEELAKKVKKKEDGYKFRNLEDVVEEYNDWYDEQYPGKVVYLLEEMEKAASDSEVEADAGAEEATEEAEESAYASWTDMEIKKEFETAIKKGMIGVVLDMIQKDDRVSANTGTTGTMPPLVLAIEFSQKGMAKFLISQGADVNATDHLGRTALHLTMAPPQSEGDDRYAPMLVKKLIEGGLDPNVQDNKGRTPLHYAAMNGNVYIVRDYIEDYNPDKSIKNKKGETAYDVAKNYSSDPKLHELLKP